MGWSFKKTKDTLMMFSALRLFCYLYSNCFNENQRFKRITVSGTVTLSANSGAINCSSRSWYRFTTLAHDCASLIF